MLCVKCNREVQGSFHNSSEVICPGCLLVVVNEIDRLSLKPFSVNGLYHALAIGNLKSWMKLNELTPIILEKWIAIDRTIWRNWAEKNKKVTDLPIPQIKASIDAVLRGAKGRTYMIGHGNRSPSQIASSGHF